MVELKSLEPPPQPFSPNYDENARCEYHDGSTGHTLKNCRDFKHKVHDLIDSQAITFDKPTLNVKTNPMFTHVGPSVNILENFNGQEFVRKVEQVKTLISIFKERLVKHGFLLEHNNSFKKNLQQLINQGVDKIGLLSKE